MPELRLLVGLKLLAGEDGSGGWASPSPEELRCGLKLFCCGSGGVMHVDGRGVEETFPLISRSCRVPPNHRRPVHTEETYRSLPSCQIADVACSSHINPPIPLHHGGSAVRHVPLSQNNDGEKRAGVVALHARNGFQDKQRAIQGPYEEFHNIHREYDEERRALHFLGREYYPSSGHNDAFLLFLLFLQVVVGVILALKFGKGEELSKGVSTVLVVSICLFVVAYK